MAKYLTTWRINPSAPWPLDPAAATQLLEMTFAAVDEALKSGRALEFGYFPNGTSGYIISSSEAKDLFMTAFAFYPWFQYRCARNHRLRDRKGNRTAGSQSPSRADGSDEALGLGEPRKRAPFSFFS